LPGITFLQERRPADANGDFDQVVIGNTKVDRADRPDRIRPSHRRLMIEIPSFTD
jgi:hypothetical protein